MTDYNKMMNDASEFYAGMVLQSGYVIDTDVGFVKEDGSPVFANMEKEEVIAMHLGNMMWSQLLKAHGHDSQEFMQFFEHIAIVQRVTEEAYFPDSLTITQAIDLENESEESRNARRSKHLFHCVRTAAMASQPDVVYLSDDGSGFAIDASNAHPLLRMYVDSMDGRMSGGAILQDEASMRTGEVQDFLNKKSVEVNGTADDIDIDSDENDDDPFRGYA
jgi:hypothetical protein